MLPLVHPFMWGMWFVAAPVLIHLINMLRHQRVEWAAMEFLLVSQKKHRTWVILKQLLLLLLRMAAIALVVLALAQPLLPERFGSFLSAQTTHHIVLLDDSFSMSENLGGGSTAFDLAKKAIQRLGESLTRPREPQTFTLLRLSRSGGYGPTRPDFQKEIVDADFSQRLDKALESVLVSQTAAEPKEALATIEQLLGENAGERRIVYLFSDFRTRQWDKPDELKQRLADLSEKQAEIRLVDCVEESGRPNLAIASLEPEAGIRAAGVQWRMQVAVQNYGPSTVKNVPVTWFVDGKRDGTVKIPEIEPGRAEEKFFYVSFPIAGEHKIEARLEADAVSVDNNRYAVVDLPVTTPVLLVDGQRTARNAKRLAAALTSRGKGIQPEIVPPDYLSAPKRPLAEFALICVSNCGKIDRLGVEHLEKYVAAGGGVLFVTSLLTRGDYVTQDLYRDGKGLFPLPLAGPQPLPFDPLDNTPDVQSTEHPVFVNFPNRVESLSKIHVHQYFAAPANWHEKSDSSLKVIMRLRNGAPLLVEKSFHNGRVLAFLSSAFGDWNNWSSPAPGAEADQGTFVPFMLNVVPYLSTRFGISESLRVGDPKQVRFGNPPFDPAVRFFGPSGDPTAETINGEPAGDNRRSATFTKTETAGFYRAVLSQPSHKTETRNFAVNVDADEGDLRALDEAQLAARLAPLKYDFQLAAKFDSRIDETEGRNLGDLFLLILLIVLALEQWFAWMCSYHVSAIPSGPLSPGRPAYLGAKGGAS
jgi:hypothetical protein